MGIVSWLFGRSKDAEPDEPDLPPIHGGSGKAPYNPAIVNCYSMSLANSLIDRFISNDLGPKQRGWKRGIEAFVQQDGFPEYSIRMISVSLPNGNDLKYFFDVSKPMGATKNLAKKLGAWPENID